jgi:hypothetical protein
VRAQSLLTRTGHFAIHHDEVFDYWRSLMPDSSAKLDIVHVDAHGDFAGAIDTGVFGYLQEQLLAYPTEERLDQIDLNRKRLTLGPVDKPVLAPARLERLGRRDTHVATGVTS